MFATGGPVKPIPTVVPDPPVLQQSGNVGKYVLWIVFVAMFLFSLVFIYLAYQTPVSKRLFHQITAFITIIATLSYYAMASGEGYSFVGNWNDHKHDHGIPDTHTQVYRQVYWARYVDWMFTTPLLLLDLSLLAGLNGSNILTIMIADIIMILTGLFAAYTHPEGSKWGWYVMGLAALGVIFYHIVFIGRKTANARDPEVGRFYTSIAGYTLVLWVLYPIVWGIGDGGRKISVDTEIVCYAILDFLAKVVFGFWLIMGHQRIPASQIILDGIWSFGFGSREGRLRVGDDEEEA